MTREEIMAMEPGAEMDALVATLVMGWQRFVPGTRDPAFDWAQWNTATGASGWFVDSDPDYYACGEECHVWRPSTDITAAWMVVEAVRERPDADGYARWYVKIHDTAIPETPWTATFRKRLGGGPPFMAEASEKDAPLAICRAALLTTIP